MGAVPLLSAVHELDTVEDAIEFCYAQGWTDGLPVVPPTPSRVEDFLAAGGRPPDEVVLKYVGRSRLVTVEKVAINAVMAGCRPEYFPVVLALVDAMGDPAFGLHGANSSTGGMALGFIVNGPIRNELGMNCRGNVLGPNNRANSTIGRALRLLQINALGSVPGAGNEHTEVASRPVLDRSAIGQPGKYTGYHVPEFEEAFPTLEPLHVMRGFAREQNVVTLFDVIGHIQISAHAEQSAAEVIDTICRYLLGSWRMRPGGNCILIISPENSEMFVRDGYTKSDIAEAVYEGTKRSVAFMVRSGEACAGMLGARGRPITEADEKTDVAIAAGPSSVHIVVAGAPAGAYIYALQPSYTGGLAMREIRRPQATESRPSSSSEE